MRRKKLFAILRAAIYGAVIFDAMLIADDVAYKSFGKSNGLLSDLVVTLAYLQGLRFIW